MKRELRLISKIEKLVTKLFLMLSNNYDVLTFLRLAFLSLKQS